MPLPYKVLKAISASISHLWASLTSLANIALLVLFEIWPVTAIGFFVKDRFPALWHRLMRQKWVQNFVSKAIFKQFGDAAPPRPHQTTMAASYPSWHGISDAGFTGRHLPEDLNFDTRPRPTAESVVELFLRPCNENEGGRASDDMRSTLLFASFAQWFTDSFLRTAHAFEFCPETGNVKLKDGQYVRKPGREKRNHSTHEIDLCQIYGTNDAMTKMLRSPDEKGCLRSQDINGEEYPVFLLNDSPVGEHGELPIKDHFVCLHDERLLRLIFKKTPKERYRTLFATGLEHSNSTIGNALFNTLFLRQHNALAREIAEGHGDWDDDRVFESARNTMIVILLNIVISDYVRHISPLDLPLRFQPGFAEQQRWYRKNRIKIEFNILYRWHGLVPSTFDFLPTPTQSSDFLHNNDWLINNGVENAVTAFSKVRAGKMVIGNTPRFLEHVKRDTVKIMRAARLDTYNAYRQRFGLAIAESFSDVTDDPELAQTLSDWYKGDIHNLEWYVGMCAESHGRGMIMGDLMFNMVAHDAFTHALTNPLLSDELFVETTFSPEGWRALQEITTLKHLVENVTTSPDTYCEFAVDGVHTDRA